MEVRIDLDAAAEQIEARRLAWEQRGLSVGPLTWRDQGSGWPPPIRTERSDAVQPDSVGVALAKAPQEGSVVLFLGGWADLVYWGGEASDDVVDEAPGWDDWLTVEDFGRLLDRLAGLFE